MNGFYGVKRVTGNLPAAAPRGGEGRIRHPAMESKAIGDPCLEAVP
jgi:hypothetical protein